MWWQRLTSFTLVHKFFLFPFRYHEPPSGLQNRFKPTDLVRFANASNGREVTLLVLPSSSAAVNKRGDNHDRGFRHAFTSVFTVELVMFMKGRRPLFLVLHDSLLFINKMNIWSLQSANDHRRAILDLVNIAETQTGTSELSLKQTY